MGGSSPHTRGARPSPPCLRAPEGIIPAYAGSTLNGFEGLTSQKDHPRIRGEHTTVYERTIEQEGSSPHTRGAHHRQHRHGDRMGIIPAYAGSTRPRSPLLPLVSDHPRIRGEHYAGTAEEEAMHGSSPHTRGAPEGRHGRRRPGRIIPAYAGSTGVI